MQSLTTLENSMTVEWDDVTRSEVLRAIQEYDRLGPESSSLRMVSPRPRRMTWYGRNAVTRRKQSWAPLMNSPPGQRLASGDFEGGKTGAVRVLGNLGFTIHPRRPPAKE
jgi:hypothetical protein